MSEYEAIAKELYKMGHKSEAKIISGLAKEVAGQGFDTKAQMQFDQTIGKNHAMSALIQESGIDGAAREH
ncbi:MULTISPECIES: hypothetical protein [unclassified Neisseria]|uniref:hypothetical protein n=1 Tax=unclassified Neisseria TaxID=2623750 RepID=UPI002666CD10|nr:MULTISPECIES: hypothetical protein [unclassified Neisseria]MDO1510220.1 hypothetical protein [Neisseria sp. MVDL19-042950]MDO1516389.1 hypothetical protein [Neisseria sp. MVDL18-041461]MDO1563537.1 hypothetical protein [Neisseria sp. MVDL20-010259]